MKMVTAGDRSLALLELLQAVEGVAATSVWGEVELLDAGGRSDAAGALSADADTDGERSVHLSVPVCRTKKDGCTFL